MSNSPIKFKALVDFKHGHNNYEADNTYKNHNITPDELDMFHRAGFVSLEDREDNVATPTNVQLVIQDGYINNTTPQI